MTTRRSFLASSAAVLGAASLVPRSRRLQQEPGKLPAPIAALASLHDKMVPITVEERRARIAKARRLLAEQDLGGLVLMSGTSLRYFTNMDWWPSERMLAVAIPRAGRSSSVPRSSGTGRRNRWTAVRSRATPTS